MRFMGNTKSISINHKIRKQEQREERTKNFVGQNFLFNAPQVFYSVKETKKGFILYEHFLSDTFYEKKKMLAKLHTWRAEIIKFSKNKIIENENNFFEEDIFDNIETVDSTSAMKLFVIMKILSSVKTPQEYIIFEKTLLEISHEESVFWAWKIFTIGKEAISAFKLMYRKHRA